MNSYQRFVDRMFLRSMNGNKENILNMLEKNPNGRFVDLGCDDGSWSIQCGARMGTEHLYGLEIVPEKVAAANSRGVKALQGDLTKPFPFEDNFFDCVHSNQVIEHLTDTAAFMREINRVLRDDGCTIISTENASSWHNIIALLCGWQMFSLTNISHKGGIGNPFALYRGQVDERNSWQHMRIFAYRGLIEYVECFGFKVESVRCSGYYPLPYWVARIDPRHGHYIAVKARKVAKI